MIVECEKVGPDFFDDAPTRHRATVEVSASPDDVFDVLLDAEAWTRWAMPITRVEWTSGFPLSVGSTRTVVMRGGLTGYEEFIAYEHGERMAFRFNEVSKKGIDAFAEDYRVTDLGDGRCRIEWVMAMKVRGGSGFGARLSDPIMGFLLARMLKKFGRLVETAATRKAK